MALVQEIIATRTPELTLAYRNVVMLAAGFKASRDANGIEHLHPVPCVIFVVKHKWLSDHDGPPQQLLPARLLTYGTVAGKQQLYAIPTDVQLAQGFIGGRAFADSCVSIEDAQFPLPGALTCAVHAVGAGPQHQRLALSAMHVLNPVASTSQPVGGIAFSDVGTSPQLRGQSSSWGGHLNANTGNAFDAQLARNVDANWFNSIYHGWNLSRQRPYVKTDAEFYALVEEMRFQIIAPDNHPAATSRPRGMMLAQFSAMVTGLPLQYEVRYLGNFSRVQLKHSLLIKLQIDDKCPAPIDGDSGSAVVTWWPDDNSTVFVGMFIGSHDQGALERIAYVIPAWELFKLENWQGALPPSTTALVPSFSMR
jgi:hypothetical protein